MSARDRFTRIVSLVADLTRRAREGGRAATLGNLAREYATTPRDINADIAALTVLGDRIDHDWLLSLSVWQQDDRVSISSAGPFRRPVQFSPEERLAIQVALVLHPDGKALAARFASHFAGHGAGTPSMDEETPDPRLAILNQAVRECREVRITYAAEGERKATEWLLEPHQVAESQGRIYVVAYAADVGDFRHFRLDRVFSVSLTDRSFEQRAGFRPLKKPSDVFRPAGLMDTVKVRFAPAIAPTIGERYPEHEVLPDGGVQVTFTTASPQWLARKVLEYGAQAEVVGPKRYRRAVLSTVA